MIQLGLKVWWLDVKMGSYISSSKVGIRIIQAMRFDGIKRQLHTRLDVLFVVEMAKPTATMSDA
jgi:hypothetical protein